MRRASEAQHVQVATAAATKSLPFLLEATAEAHKRRFQANNAKHRRPAFVAGLPASSCNFSLGCAEEQRAGDATSGHRQLQQQRSSRRRRRPRQPRPQLEARNQNKQAHEDGESAPAHLVSNSPRLLLHEQLEQQARHATNFGLAISPARSRLHQKHQEHQEQQLQQLQQQQQQRRPNARLLLFNQTDAASAMVGLARVILVILICVLMFKLHAVPGAAHRSAPREQSAKSLARARNSSRRRRRTSSSSSSNNNNNSGATLKRQVEASGGDDHELGRQQDYNNEQLSHKATTKISARIEQQHLGPSESRSQHGPGSESARKQSQQTSESSILSLERMLNKLYWTTTSCLLGGAGNSQAAASVAAAAASARGPHRRLSQPSLPSSSAQAAAISAEGPAASGTNWHQRASHERRRRFSDTNAIISSLKLPPGPTGLPFLGYLPFLGAEIHLTLTELSQRFGPIYQIFLGGIRVVVLNDASLVRQAFKQTVFSGRPDTQLTRILQGYGIVNSDGALWKEQRAFLHSALRKLGAKSLMSGTNGLEAKIQNQVREFVKDLSAHASDGKPCQVRPIVARAVSSVVGSVVMNLTYRKYEEKFDRLIELMQEGFRLVSIAMPLDFIPLFRFLPGVSYAFQKMKRNRAETSAFFQTVADEHRHYLRETFDLDAPNTAGSLHPRVSHLESMQPIGGAVGPASKLLPKTILTSESIAARSLVKQAQVARVPQQQQQQQQQQQAQRPIDLDNIVARDLVDAYIVQQKKHENDGKENYFSDQQLVQIMSDIFSAGLETVTSTIEWSILFLILNPECQERIQNEIDKVVGRSRLPQLDDLAQMPYTEATIYEVLRRSNVVALGNAHATLADATIGGYRIPKGTQVLPNLYGIHMNPKLWFQPERFDPGRFIVNERAQRPDYFIPFSVGRRMCLGDVLAKMEVFLFLVGLLQKYDLSVHEEDRARPPEVKGTIGVSNAPVPFRVALRARADPNQANARAPACENAAPPPHTD